MSLQQDYHRAHIERQQRMGAIPRKAVVTAVPEYVPPSETTMLLGRIEELEKINRQLRDELKAATKERDERDGRIRRVEMALQTEGLPYKWRPRISQIVEVVAEHFKLTPDDIYSARKDYRATHARQVAMYLASVMTIASSRMVAKALNRESSTIRHGACKMDMRYRVDLNISAEIEEIREKLNAIGRLEAPACAVAAE